MRNWYELLLNLKVNYLNSALLGYNMLLILLSLYAVLQCQGLIELGIALYKKDRIEFQIKEPVFRWCLYPVPSVFFYFMKKKNNE